MSKHIRKRGSKYHYICRVPADLLHVFPSPVISRALHTDDKKSAALLGVSIDYATKQLFVQLRSGMLDATLQRLLINLYLRNGLNELQAIANGTKVPYEDIVQRKEAQAGYALTNEDRQELRATIAEKMAGYSKADLAAGDSWMHNEYAAKVACMLQEQHGVSVSNADKKVLVRQYENASKKLSEAEAGIHRGEWGLYEALKDRVDAELSKPYALLADVLEKYALWYSASRPNIKAGTLDDMHVECRVLLEIIGNISIAEVNTLDTLTRVKTILRRYPLNRVQKFPNQALSAILKVTGYPVIAIKTANEYIKRLKAVLDYANKAKALNSVNVVTGELFCTEKAEEEERSAYDTADITRLIDAMCTKPLWRYNPAKPERFWIILIALFQGFRLGNIVGLTKRDICQTDKGAWVFNLRSGKTKATVRPVAICDSLQLLGFLDWVNSLNRDRLFQDSADSFSKWYNRTDTRPDGTKYEGFEAAFITRDRKKCLYSLRHSFAGNVFDVTGDYKITSDMMGHSTGGSVTARYTKATKAETLKAISDKMSRDGIDLERLKARAVELFGM
ncbi:MAG: hypothetical protein A2X82_19575 [Geobacteraceae bacterium GWC2_55_20]|nr:MAG: hypothetical protein A2X82_19575 [Geobacteraceae bacterium GWC2_55_20]OGU23116.1 MAG: hypothetical protein A2X85_10825 [Geobacteraceae bacterium GWF2_54_21]HCE66027.1 hypothetical protein [Geobacter sp.]